MLDATGRRVVVFGAGGFIGSRVVAMALVAGAEQVVAIPTGDPWRLAGLEDVRLAIRAPAALTEALSDADTPEPDAVVLLAYRPPPRWADPTALVMHELDVNALGAYHAAVSAALAGARVVFTSSADVYGHGHAGLVDEDVAPAPASPYAVAKLAAEHLVSLAARPDAVILRIATVFGPGENGPRAIPSFTRALLANGAPLVDREGNDVRDYVHVDDVAAAVVNACVNDSAAGGSRAFNIGSGVGRTTLAVLDTVRRAVGVDNDKPARHRPVDRAFQRLVLDVGRAKSVLGFEPNRDFEGLVRAEVDWLRGHLAGDATYAGGAGSRPAPSSTST